MPEDMDYTPSFDGFETLQQLFPMLEPSVLDSLLSAHSFDVDRAASAAVALLDELNDPPQQPPPEPSERKQLRPPELPERNQPTSPTASDRNSTQGGDAPAERDASQITSSWSFWQWWSNSTNEPDEAKSKDEGNSKSSSTRPQTDEFIDLHPVIPSHRVGKDIHVNDAMAPLEEPTIDAISSDQWSAVVVHGTNPAPFTVLGQANERGDSASPPDEKVAESASACSLPTSARTNTSSSSSDSGADSADEEHKTPEHRYQARINRARASNRVRGASASSREQLKLGGLGRLELPDNKAAVEQPRMRARVAPTPM